MIPCGASVSGFWVSWGIACLERVPGHTFSMVHAGQVVGVVALFRIGDGQFELARMAVDPAFQGQGIGRALAKAALAVPAL